MKTIVLANQKGGVGKSAITTQLAYFFAEKMGKNVLVIDLDHQGSTSKCLKTGNIAVDIGLTSSQILMGDFNELDQTIDLDSNNKLYYCPADKKLINLEKKADQHSVFATGLSKFIASKKDSFDVCIIDTNPNPDIRQLASLVVSDFVLSPIQVNQEAIDGIGDLLNNDVIGVRKIQNKINKNLKFLGVLPNMVEPTPFQQNNLNALIKAYPALLIKLDNGFASIKKSTAISEAQAFGIPIFKIGKTSSKKAWAQIKPVFYKIAKLMEV